MKMEIKVSGCPHEDVDDLEMFMNARKNYFLLDTIKEKLHSFLIKNDDDLLQEKLSDETIKFLESIIDEMWID